MTVPPADRDSGNAREILTSHVAYLAQPALKGRQPRTIGSRLSRRYIESRFRAYGLVPWGQTKDYEQSFRFGKNVVGVLPGSDTNLTREFVLVCAHYDHLGKHRGSIYPGAADNAAGVAVLLETARHLSRIEPRPKRSIAFISFDCEEQALLGSFAFTCREDVRQAKIAAVINLDMLGREFMDVVNNTVFVAGTAEYPDLRERVRHLGLASGIRVLPVGTDLIGPRSDHAAFESLGAPCLFFTCGMFPDYHKPTDTADRLDYDGIERTAKVVLQTASELAHADTVKRVEIPENGDLAELRTLTTVLTEVLDHDDEAGIEKDEVEAFQPLKEQAESLLESGHYDRRTRTEFIMTATGTLVPYLWPMEESEKQSNEAGHKQSLLGMQFAQHFYLNYRHEILEGYRKLVAQLLKHHPGIFRGMPTFDYEVYDIAADDIHLIETGPATYQLYALANQFTIKVEVKRSKWLMNSFNVTLAGSLTGLHCEGTREQLGDYCLLVMRGNQTNAMHSAKIKTLLRAVSETAAQESYRELLNERLESGGFTDETDWITHCILTGTPVLAKRALRAARNERDASIREAVCLVLADRNRSPEVRAEALKLLVSYGGKQGLMAVCGVLDDSSPLNMTENFSVLSGDSPFADRAAVKALRTMLQQHFDKSSGAPKTIGELAHEQLKKVTKTDFGQEATLWRSWIETNTQESGEPAS